MLLFVLDEFSEFRLNGSILKFTLILPLRGEEMIAFVSRFMSTCSILFRSLRTVSELLSATLS